MGPKPTIVDTEMKFVILKVVGGEPASNAVLSAKLSPFGVVKFINLSCRTLKKQTMKSTNQQKNIQTLDYTLDCLSKLEKLKTSNYYQLAAR